MAWQTRRGEQPLLVGEGKVTNVVSGDEKQHPGFLPGFFLKRPKAESSHVEMLKLRFNAVIIRDANIMMVVVAVMQGANM